MAPEILHLTLQHKKGGFIFECQQATHNTPVLNLRGELP
jgi:hypothetical protein